MFLLKTDGERRASEKGTHTVWQTEKWKGEEKKIKKGFDSHLPNQKPPPYEKLLAQYTEQELLLPGETHA